MCGAVWAGGRVGGCLCVCVHLPNNETYISKEAIATNRLKSLKGGAMVAHSDKVSLSFHLSMTHHLTTKESLSGEYKAYCYLP